MGEIRNNNKVQRNGKAKENIYCAGMGLHLFDFSPVRVFQMSPQYTHIVILIVVAGGQICLTFLQCEFFKCLHSTHIYCDIDRGGRGSNLFDFSPV